MILSPNSPTHENNGRLAKGSLTLTTCPPLTAHDFDLLTFFDARSDGLEKVATTDHEGYGVDYNEEELIERFVRTPHGNGVAVVRASGGEAWALEGQRENTRLRRVGRWKGKGLTAIIDSGKSSLIYLLPMVSMVYLARLFYSDV